MEEKESTVSGSLAGNSDTDSPPPVSSLNVAQPPPHHHHHQLPMSSSVTPSPPNDVVSAPNDFLTKKKRGRPRKYDSDGNLRVTPASFHHHHYHPNNNNSLAPPPGFYMSQQHAMSAVDYGHDQQQRRMAFPSARRGRGRPGGSGGSWQVLASLDCEGELFENTAGGDFTPHVLTVNIGEDVTGKMMSLSQKGSRGICVLSANGAVSNVTIRQPSSGGILTYEGRYEILSLTGSFPAAADYQSNGGCTRNRTGGLSVSLASSDGRVIGGGVAGLLLAASPIQMVVGSFTPSGYNKVQKRKYNREQHPPAPAAISQPANVPQVGFTIQPLVSPPPTTTGSSLPGQTSHSNAAGAGHQEHNNKVDGKQTTTMFHHPMNNTRQDHHGGWNGTMNSSTSSIHRPSPDINVSAPSDDDVPAVSGVF